MSIASCQTCTHRKDDECRRFPPHVSVVMIPVKSALSGMNLEPSPVAAFPNIAEDSYCGEWKLKLTTA